MLAHRLPYLFLLLSILAALLAGCTVPLSNGGALQLPTPPFGAVHGVVTWRDGDTVTPLANAYVSLEALDHGTLNHVWTVQADEQGRYAFPLLRSGQYMMPYVLWPVEDGAGECRFGKWAGSFGRAFYTADRANPFLSLAMDGVEVDVSDIGNVVAAADDAGVFTLGFALNYGQVEVTAGSLLTEDIELACW